MAHNFNPEEWEARKQAKADLGKPHAPLNSVPALRDRMEKIEILLCIKPTEP